ncbi:MAG: O-antigen ligase family protein [Chloroflexia bacterium]
MIMIPNRTILVLLVMTFALGAIAFSLQGSVGLVATLLPAACVGFLIVISRFVGWTQAALALLVVAALLNRYVVSVGGLHLKPEHAAIGIGLLVFTWQFTRRERPAWGLADGLLAAWVVSNALGSINAPIPTLSLKLTLQLAILFAGYVLIQQFTRRRADLFFGHALLLGGITLVAAFGVLVHLVYPLGLDLGMQINPTTKQPTVFATLYEGNLFGSTVMVGLLWWLLLLLFGGIRFRRVGVIGITICTVAIEVSLARGAWLALVAIISLSIVAYFMFRRRLTLKPNIAMRTLAMAATSVVLLSLFIWAKPAALVATAWVGTNPPTSSKETSDSSTDGSSSDIIDRVTSLSESAQDQTVTQRITAVQRATHDWTLHPLIGWGPGSYGQKYINTSWRPDWLGMLPLRILHDTGLIGVLLFLAFSVVLLRDAVRALARSADSALRIMLVAHLVGVVALFMAYLVTEGMQLFVPWLLIGLFSATIRATNSALAYSSL